MIIDELGSLISKLRVRKKLTCKELGKKIGVDGVHIFYVEKGERFPSGSLLIRLAEVLGRDKVEVENLKKQFLFLRAKAKAPKEIQDILSIQDREKISTVVELSFTGSMPPAFIESLKKDLNRLKDKSVIETLSFSKVVLDGVLQGKYVLSREQVIELAMRLNVPIEGYLLLSDYMPEEIKKLVKHEGIISMFRTLEKLTPQELERMINTITSVLSLYEKDKDSRK